MEIVRRITVKFFVVFTVWSVFMTGPLYVAFAGTATTTDAVASGTVSSQFSENAARIAVLNQEIAGYETELRQVGTDKKTLQAAIDSFDLQKKNVQARVALTQVHMGTTKLDIQQLGGLIIDARQSIQNSKQTLEEYLREIQKEDGKPLLVRMLSSASLAKMWDETVEVMEMQSAVQKNMQTLKNEEAALAGSKAASKKEQATLIVQQKQLFVQQQSLIITVQAKNELLTVTEAKESNYEKLLAAAEAELNSFATFTKNAGGSKLLVDQTSCDAWGCYYNQRDAAWGGDALDGTKYTLANAGCLVTAVAMVLTHYGYRNVTPIIINANSDNFAAYSPDLLLATISVDGVTITRKAVNVNDASIARKIAVIDAALTTGHPAIVGLHVDGGTHFVVLVSGSGGEYVMRDPYIANGDDINFSTHYSLKDIYSVTQMVIRG